MAHYLTFVIPSGGSGGTLEVRGKFDETWGFSLFQGPGDTAYFQYIGFPQNNLFRVILKDNMAANHRFNLKFSTTDIGYDIDVVAGNITVGGANTGPNPFPG